MELKKSIFIRLFLSILAVYRLAKLISEDDGPLFICKRIRYFFKDKAWVELGKPTDFSNIDDRYFGKWYSISEGIECPYCTGIWISLLIFPLVIKSTKIGDLFLLLMSISAGQAFLQSQKR